MVTVSFAAAVLVVERIFPDGQVAACGCASFPEE